MNRRTFLRKMLETSLAVIAGSLILVKNTTRKFIRAEKTANYPGRIKPTPRAGSPWYKTVGKWSG